MRIWDVLIQNKLIEHSVSLKEFCRSSEMKQWKTAMRKVATQAVQFS